MFKKIIAAVAAVSLTSALFAAVPTTSTTTPRMTPDESRTAIVNGCRKAHSRWLKGDRQYVQRLFEGLPFEQQQMLALACQAYSEGFADGQHDLS